MKKTSFGYIVVALLAMILGLGNSYAQKGAELLTSKPKASTEITNSVVHGNGTLLQSHIKSLGTIGKTQRYEVISARQRGLDSPNNATLFVYDNETDSLSVVASSGGAGLGGAIVQSSGYAIGQYLSFSKYKPDTYNQNVNSGNANAGNTSLSGGNNTATSTGGTSSATGGTGGTSSATGGAGGTGGSVTSTGGYGTGTGAGVQVNVNSGSANGNGTISIGGSPTPN